jgi:hypothetical protein
VEGTDRHEVLRGLSVGTVPLPVRYRVSFSTAAAMATSLAGVRTVCGRPTFMCSRCCTSCPTEALLQVVSG